MATGHIIQPDGEKCGPQFGDHWLKQHDYHC